MSKQTKYPKADILGIEVDNISAQKAIEEIVEHSGARAKGAIYIVKPYVEFFSRRSLTDTHLRNVLNNAYLSLPDGVSLKWALYFKDKTTHRQHELFTSGAKIVLRPSALRQALPYHSWGSDFTLKLLKAAAKSRRTVYLVGSPKANPIDETAEYLLEKIPQLKIVGTFRGRDTRVGYFTNAMEIRLLKELETLRPDIILVGLGFPRQEKVIARLASKLKHGVLIGEGGTFDYKAFGGKLKKAPEVMQRSGLEWLWRLALEPTRFKRQLEIPKFMHRVQRHYSKNSLHK